MADTRQPGAPENEVSFVFPLSGPPFPQRKLSFTDSQRSDLRRIIQGRLDESNFADFQREVEGLGSLHAAFKARVRLSEPAIEAALVAERKRIIGAREALKHLAQSADLRDYLQPCVQQPFTPEEHWQSVIKAGTPPERGVPVPGPDSPSFELGLEDALKRAHAQAEADGRIRLRTLTIEELVSTADQSLRTVEEVLDRAITALGSQKRRGGRPREIWHESLVSRLADAYAKYLGAEPTSTADNDFHRLVDLVFDAVGWSRADCHLLVVMVLKERKGTKT
jgi:hypothetical protein